MLNSSNFLEIIKRAAVDADEQSQPCDFLFGTVVSGSPLKIRVEQKLELGGAQLVLTRNVSDFKVKIDGETEIEIKNALKAGDKVVLLKQRGGQKFLVLDRRAES